jgi:hypothetical protein
MGCAENIPRISDPIHAAATTTTTTTTVAASNPHSKINHKVNQPHSKGDNDREHTIAVSIIIINAPAPYPGMVPRVARR